MKTIYTFFIALCTIALFACDDSSSDKCTDYSGPALKKGVNGGCYYEDNGATVTLTDPEACKCAK
ncbi:hypothetical protein [Pontibacter burrus]|uniref:Lipoprotein n=1 Tax=Pontibacter burrus TaxID=2704466 RepID=A0A6B3LRS9_9BACT|nr:hypothetical protein [Pontibacter burrus]NEM96201.1 hypothetical protein [Pontibacter burrus]